MDATPSTFRDIINLWPRRSDLQRELLLFAAPDRRKGPTGQPARPSVRHWVQVDRIPREWFTPLERAARRRGIPGITARLLEDIRRAGADRNP